MLELRFDGFMQLCRIGACSPLVNAQPHSSSLNNKDVLNSLASNKGEEKKEKDSKSRILHQSISSATLFVDVLAAV